MKYLRRLWCHLFGHQDYMKFHSQGKYYCTSSGPYDCLCMRCDYDWSLTKEGQQAMIEHMGNKFLYDTILYKDTVPRDEEILDPRTTLVDFRVVSSLPHKPICIVKMHDIDGDERIAFYCWLPNKRGVKRKYYDVHTGESISYFLSG